MFFVKNSPKLKKIGLMGGCFDPAHKGHIAGGLFAKQAMELNEVWFVVSKQKYFSDIQLTKVEDRINMIKIAIQKFKYFYVKEDEIKQKINN